MLLFFVIFFFGKVHIAKCTVGNFCILQPKERKRTELDITRERKSKGISLSKVSTSIYLPTHLSYLGIYLYILYTHNTSRYLGSELMAIRA